MDCRQCSWGMRMGSPALPLPHLLSGRQVLEREREHGGKGAKRRLEGDESEVR